MFLPLTSPATDYYGGDRKGMGLFGDCLVALDALTGKRLWHFQTVHHNLWDYDIPAPPNLVTVTRDGQAGGGGGAGDQDRIHVCVRPRERQAAVRYRREVQCPASEVPGEQAWPTQPVPVKPPPYARQKMTRR